MSSPDATNEACPEARPRRGRGLNPFNSAYKKIMARDRASKVRDRASKVHNMVIVIDDGDDDTRRITRGHKKKGVSASQLSSLAVLTPPSRLRETTDTRASPSLRCAATCKDAHKNQSPTKQKKVTVDTDTSKPAGVLLQTEQQLRRTSPSRSCKKQDTSQKDVMHRTRTHRACRDSTPSPKGDSREACKQENDTRSSHHNNKKQQKSPPVSSLRKRTGPLTKNQDARNKVLVRARPPRACKETTRPTESTLIIVKQPDNRRRDSPLRACKQESLKQTRRTSPYRRQKAFLQEVDSMQQSKVVASASACSRQGSCPTTSRQERFPTTPVDSSSKKKHKTTMAEFSASKRLRLSSSPSFTRLHHENKLLTRQMETFRDLSQQRGIELERIRHVYQDEKQDHSLLKDTHALLLDDWKESQQLRLDREEEARTEVGEVMETVNHQIRQLTVERAAHIKYKQKYYQLKETVALRNQHRRNREQAATFVRRSTATMSQQLPAALKPAAVDDEDLSMFHDTKSF